MLRCMQHMHVKSILKSTFHVHIHFRQSAFESAEVSEGIQKFTVQKRLLSWERKKEREEKTPARHKEKTEARDILPEDMTLLKSVEKAVASVSALPLAVKTEVQVSESSLWGRRRSLKKKRGGGGSCQVQ